MLLDVWDFNLCHLNISRGNPFGISTKELEHTSEISSCFLPSAFYHYYFTLVCTFSCVICSSLYLNHSVHLIFPRQSSHPLCFLDITHLYHFHLSALFPHVKTVAAWLLYFQKKDRLNLAKVHKTAPANSVSTVSGAPAYSCSLC